MAKKKKTQREREEARREAERKRAEAAPEPAVMPKKQKGLGRKEALELARARARRGGFAEPYLDPITREIRRPGQEDIPLTEKEKALIEYEKGKVAPPAEAPPEEEPEAPPEIAEAGILPSAITKPLGVVGEILGGGEVGGVKFGLREEGVELLADTVPIGPGQTILFPKGATAFKAAFESQKALKLKLTTQAGTITKLSKTIKRGIYKWTAAGAGTAVGFFGLSKIIGGLLPDGELQKIDTALGQVREKISLYPIAVSSGTLTPLEAMMGLDDLTDDINRYETSMQLAITSWRGAILRLNPEYTSPIKQRIKKLELAIEISEQLVWLSAAAPTPENIERTSLLLAQLNAALESDVMKGGK